MNNKERSQVMKMLYLITQIGFTMVVTIFISMGIAYLIKRIFGKDFMVWFIVIGVLAGLAPAIRASRTPVLHALAA